MLPWRQRWSPTGRLNTSQQTATAQGVGAVQMLPEDGAEPKTNLTVKTGSSVLMVRATEAHTPPDEAIMELQVVKGEVLELLEVPLEEGEVREVLLDVPDGWIYVRKREPGADFKYAEGLVPEAYLKEYDPADDEGDDDEADRAELVANLKVRRARALKVLQVLLEDGEA